MSYYHTKGYGLRAILSGNVDWIKEISNCKEPPILAEPNPGFLGNEVIDSHKVVCIMDDALKGYPEYKSLNVEEMRNIHRSIFPTLERIDYSASDCVCYNDDPWFDEDDYAKFQKRGVRKKDVDLSNAIMMHKETDVIRLLQTGATPYFLDLEVFPDKQGLYYFEDVAPALGTLEIDISFWWTEVPKKFPNDILSMTDNELCYTMFSLYNIAAHRHILHIVDENILPEVKRSSEEFVKQMCGEE